MPPPSEASQRYEIIDRCLTNPYRKYPTMDDLKWAIERELNTAVATVTIQKDIALMKLPREEGGYGAPIKFSRSVNGYYYDLVNFPDYTIKQFGLNVNSLLTIIHEKSHVDKSTIIGNNCLIGSMVTIAQNSFLDNFVRINRNCSIGHHTILKNNVILNPGVNIAGHVIVQENTTIGMGTNVLNKIKIGKNCVIGAGSLVTKDIPDGVVAYGSPCKIIRENSY